MFGIMSRTFGQAACEQELAACLAYKDRLVAMDLAGDELGFPGELFVGHFKRVRDAGLRITVHAGEAAGSASIWQAIKELGAERIGHAARVLPTALVLTRQHVPTLDRSLFSPAALLRRGAYVLNPSSASNDQKNPDVILMASGSEVSLVVAAGEPWRLHPGNR